jgi:Family of unknown function (DUF6152)
LKTRQRVGTLKTKIALSLFALSTSLWAHHSFAAEYDSSRRIHLAGTILRTEWTNPHAWIHLRVRTPDGSTKDWTIEAGTPNTLFRRGLTKESLKPGTEVVVDVYPAKDGSTVGSGRDVTLADGKRLALGNAVDGQ